MNKLPTISVLITVYNGENYIGRCLRSILNQSVKREDYEIIVVADPNTDRTDFALKIFEDEIRLIKNDTHLGYPQSLNRGLQEAKGQFLVRLDGDDYVHSEYLNILSLFLRMNKNLDAVACDYVLVNDKEEHLQVKNCLENPIACGVMYRTEQLMDIGKHFNNEFMECTEDDLRMRFLKRYSIHRIPLPLYRYRRHEGNMTNQEEHMERAKSLLHQKHGTS